MSRPGARHMRHGFIALGLAPVLALVLGLSFNRWYFGYWIVRPGVSKSVRGIASVHTLTLIDSGNTWTPPPPEYAARPIGDPNEYLRKAVTDGGDSELSFEDNVIHSLWKRGKISMSTPALPFQRSEALCKSLRDSGALRLATPGYEASAAWISGVVVEAVDSHGKEIIVMAVRQFEVSNDHRAFVEAVFERTQTGGLGRRVGIQRFYWDVAGLEWLDGYGSSLAFLAATMPPALLVSMAFQCLAFRQRRRSRRGHCFVCNYDLVGLDEGSDIVKCPECGRLVPRTRRPV